MMRLIKYCELEFNIAIVCKTLQLGTFDYYRELDPEFSIADATEGFILYRGPTSPITVGANALNSISGGAVRVNDATNFKSPPPPSVPGAVEFKVANSEWVFTEEGLKAKVGPDLEVRLRYPNSYMFCVSQIEDHETPEPTSVSASYDSHYFISKNADVGEFVGFVTKALCDQLTLDDLDLSGKENIPYSQLSLPVEAVVLHNTVEYVVDKTIRLTCEADFTLNRYTEIYFSSMFRKPDCYIKNAEYRFVILLKHPTLGILSVKKQPKLLQLMPISSTVSTT